MKVNGKPLERGDEPSELPSILTRRLMRDKPGDKVTLSVVRENQPPKDIEITMGDYPMRAHQAKRSWADDLGFGTRDLVFSDRYGLKLPKDSQGVIVSLMRGPKAPAQTGGAAHE